jgi:RND family efflux transporter MFP subunit
VGSLISPNKVQLSPKTSGKIEFLEVRPGDKVKPGQPLVRIDPTDARAQVLQARANLAAARSRLAQARLQEGPTNASVAGEVANSNADVNTASAQLEQAEKNGAAQIAQAQAQVEDATAKVASADANVESAKAVVAKEQANFANAITNYNRIRDLYNQNFVAAQDVDNAQTAMKAQAETLSVAKAALLVTQRARESTLAQLKVAQKNVGIVQQTTRAATVAAQAKVEQAKTALKVAQANTSQNPAFKENIAALAAAVRVADAQVDSAESALRQTTLSSPIEGTVTARNGEPGSLASPGQPVVTVEKSDVLYFSAQLPIENAGMATPGTEATITINGMEKAPIIAPIEHVSLSGDNAARQFGVLLNVKNNDGKLRSGMFGRMKFVTQTLRAEVTVPREAVRTTVKGTTVAVVDKDNKVSVRPVTIGATDGVDVEILSGVKVGEKVIISSQSAPRDGQTVMIPKPGEGRGQGGGGRPRGARSQ